MKWTCDGGGSSEEWLNLMKCFRSSVSDQDDVNLFENGGTLRSLASCLSFWLFDPPGFQGAHQNYRRLASSSQLSVIDTLFSDIVAKWLSITGTKLRTGHGH
jgi:hypothetical protein